MGRGQVRHGRGGGARPPEARCPLSGLLLPSPRPAGVVPGELCHPARHSCPSSPTPAGSVLCSCTARVCTNTHTHTHTQHQRWAFRNACCSLKTVSNSSTGRRSLVLYLRTELPPPLQPCQPVFLDVPAKTGDLPVCCLLTKNT